jgi:hypothetical protein
MTALLSCDQPKSANKSATTKVESSPTTVSKSSSTDTEPINAEASTSENASTTKTLEEGKDIMQSTKEVGSEVSDKVTEIVDEVPSMPKDAVEAVKSDVTKAKDKVNDTPTPSTKIPEVTKPAVETTRPEIKKDVVPTQTSKPEVEKPTVSDVTKPEKVVEKPAVQPSTTETKPDTKPAKPRQAQSKPMHSYFNYVLSKYVTDQGKVDYKGIGSEIKNLDKYITDLQRFPPKDDWSKNETLAYWINAYNAFTIKMICDNYPLASIKDLHSGKPWDHKWIEIDGKTLSLNDIENGIIRPTFKEPRIHFAVNCAAKSCPPLANEAFTKTNLDVLLEKRTKSFINNASYNDLTKNPAMVSKIFSWYKEDFGDVVTFVNKYIYDGVKPITAIDFLEYDWTLNN